MKLDELWFPGRVDVVNLTGLLTSQRFSFWWEGGCWSVIFCWFVPNRSRHAQDDRVAVMVTMVTVMPDHRRCENCAEVELA